MVAADLSRWRLDELEAIVMSEKASSLAAILVRNIHEVLLKKFVCTPLSESDRLVFPIRSELMY
jgi:hypothetical protein